MKPKKYTQPKDFVQDEIDYLLAKCNFVNYEKDLFLLRATGSTIEEASEILDLPYDTVRKLSRRVNKKIRRVL